MAQLLTFHRPSQSIQRTSHTLHLTPRRLPTQLPLASSLPPELQRLFQSQTGTQLTAGTLLGFATGYAIKRVGQLLLLIVGVQVVAVQLMSKKGWVIVNWDAVTDDLAPHVGRNKVDRLWEIAKYRVPFAGAFSAGCLAGLKWT